MSVTFKNIVARNIAKYRKAAGLTQSQLAEKLNYSDKSVSKWERAEGTPDTETLVAMARLFGVTVNELISDAQVQSKVNLAEAEGSAIDSHADATEDSGETAESDREESAEGNGRKQNLTLTKISVTVMAVAAVWVLCVITLLLFSAIAPSVAAVWNCRIAAYFMTGSLLVWYIFTAIWWGGLWRTVAASAMTWSAAAALHLSFPTENALFFCAVAAAFQVIIICAELVAKDMARRK